MAHEIWSLSEQYPGSVLFSPLDSHSKLLMASGKLVHVEGTSVPDTHNSIIKFIQSVKAISADNLRMARHDIDLCNWSLMSISIVLNEEDENRRDQVRRSFLVFRGTSHLFGDQPSQPLPVEYSASRMKEIRETRPK